MFNFLPLASLTSLKTTNLKEGPDHLVVKGKILGMGGRPMKGKNNNNQSHRWAINIRTASLYGYRKLKD